MKLNHKIICFALGLSSVGAQTPIPAPYGWGDFQMGMVESRRSPWQSEMIDAINSGIKLDRRYTYATNTEEIMPNGQYAFLFTSWYNYSKDKTFLNKGVKPALTVYMIQNSEDGLDAVKKWTADKTYMQKYFAAIKVMLDSSKGTNPIYVLEPDAWSYLIQNDVPNMGESNLSSLCHINDLGIPELAEFKNEIRDLPKALIKYIKANDPTAYTGILMAHWSFIPNGFHGELVDQPDQVVVDAAKGAAAFAEKLLGTYRGDFIGVEKNGQDAGAWGPGSSWYWTSDKNRKYVLWTKTLSESLNLPVLGWQICAGHTGLPNTTNAYEDTFFEYFFTNKKDFINANWIGILGGCNNQGKGTTPTIKTNAYDQGWFYNKLNEFNLARPYIKSASSPNTPIQMKPSSAISVQKTALGYQLKGYTGKIELLNSNGQSLLSWDHQDGGLIPQKLAKGSYILKDAKGFVQSLSVQ